MTLRAVSDPPPHTPIPSAVARLASAAAAMASATPDAAVLHHAKRAVVDWAAATIAGMAADPLPRYLRALDEELMPAASPATAAVCGSGFARLCTGPAASARTVALLHGTAAHTLEVDDIYREAIYHPGAPTIAAALALAQRECSSGLALLQAVVVGYEVSTRVGATLGRAHYRHWHNTGTVGTFGAAAAAAALLGLDGEATAHAYATAATMAAGLQQAFRSDSMSKPLHAGRAAEGGLLAALLAAQGVTGAIDILDGEAGMGVAMADAPHWEGVAFGMGQRFHTMEITFKNHACCGHTFSPIDAALALQAQMGLRAADIARVEVHTYRPALEVAGEPDPRTAAQARFSIPYVVAHALLHGSVRLSAVAPERLNDPVLRDLMGRVSLAVDPDLDAAFPHQRAARVVLHSRDGRRGEFLQPHRRGDPELPLSDAELSDKFRELVVPAWGEARAQQVLERLWALEHLTDLQVVWD